MSDHAEIRGIGDNSGAALLDSLDPMYAFNPPDRDEIEAEIAGLLHRRDQLLSAVERVPAIIVDSESEGRASDLARMLAVAIKASEERRKARAAPITEVKLSVDAVYKRLSNPMEEARSSVLKRLTAYKVERERAAQLKAHQEIERLRAEAAEARANAEALVQQADSSVDLWKAIDGDSRAKLVESELRRAEHNASVSPAELTRSRSDWGAVSSLRSGWAFEITDSDKLDLEVLRPYLPQAAIESAIRAFIRAGGRKLTGAQIFETRKAVAR